MEERVNVSLEISRLLRYGAQRGLLDSLDRVWAANRLLALVGEGEFRPCPVEEELPWPAEPLSRLCDFAGEKGLIDPENGEERDRFDTELMACLTPAPSVIVRRFSRLEEQSPKAATDWYYALSTASNYIRADRVAKDQKWTAATPYGDLVVTINLSKPEKDPKAIAAAKNAPAAGYPLCALCRENEGFLGSATQAARGSHRLIPLELSGERWFLQYSPYVYYPEHCIVLSQEHRPMAIRRETFVRLLDFVTRFPHYFLGSNADLPIVGGSILSHDHFQGGAYEFPMAKAPVDEQVSFPAFPGVTAGIVRWPMSVLRLRGRNREELTELANLVLEKWRGWTDESVDVLAFSGGEPHNTVTPIARRRGEDYELDLVLRNNRCTDEHPLGLFHPHAQYHHIKRENIGLIEVMGLAILPPRLLDECALMEQALAHPEKAEEIFALPQMVQHRAWYEQLAAQKIPQDRIARRIQESIGEIFAKILGNAGVFKDDNEGRAAFRRFCASL